jgi:hypothetical protein
MQAKQLVSSKPKEHPIGQKPLTLRDGSVSVKIYGTWSHSKITDPLSGKKIKNYIPESLPFGTTLVATSSSRDLPT